jgi:hypothetical protein
MEKDIAPYQESLELKELGFNEHCFGEWQNLKTGKNLVVDEEDRIYNISVLGADIKAPTFSQAFRWFREKYKLSGTPQYFIGGFYCFTINDMKDTEKSNILFSEYKTYEEAELACLKKLIEIVKDKK